MFAFLLPHGIGVPGRSRTVSGLARTPFSRRFLAAAALLFGASLFLLASSASISFARTIRTDFDRPYGPVLAVALSGNTLYLGGEFDHVGPLTGNAVSLSPTTGRLVHDPRLGGLVLTSIPDGAGGWFVTGDFRFGLDIHQLVHIRADGSLGTLNPTNMNGSIYALALKGSTLYLGGNFTTIEGLTRVYAAAIDLETEAVTPWDPNIELSTSNTAAVNSLAVGNGLVYIGGHFARVGGSLRQNAAAVDTSTASLSPWNPSPDETPLAFAVRDSVVYMAGGFHNVSGQPRDALAAVHATTGAPTAWNPSASFTCRALLLSGNTVYVGGGFDMIGGQSRWAFAAIDAMTGQIRPWPSLVGNGPNFSTVWGLALMGSTLYIGGQFSTVGGETRLNIAAIDTTTGAVTSWNAGATYTVNTLASGDSLLFAGGRFDRIGGEPRHRLAAIDIVTGRTTPWNPDANEAVRALAVSGSTVYAGGSFGQIGGQQHRAIVALDGVSGAPIPNWPGTADGAVRALVVNGSLLYIGGSFRNVNGQPRSRLAALDLTSGLPTAWQPDADSTVRALVTDGSAVYVGGDFDHAGGASRMRVAALDAVTGTAVPWNLHSMSPDENVYALAVDGSTLYAGGSFTMIGGQARRNLAALHATNGDATPWAHDYVKSVYAFSVVGAKGGTVYVGSGGDFGDGTAALDATTGASRIWNPLTDGSIFCLATDGPYVYAGGQNGVYAIEALGVTATLLSLFQAESNSDGIVLRWQPGSDLREAVFHIERSETQTGPWTRLAAEIRSEGEQFVATDRAVARSHRYHYRLIAEMPSGTMTFGPIEATAGPRSETFGLTRISPTPTSGPVTIEFVVPREAHVRLRVLDIQGRVTARLVDGTMRPGVSQAVWSGEDSHGPAPGGVYFLRFEAADLVITKRLVLAR